MNSQMRQSVIGIGESKVFELLSLEGLKCENWKFKRAGIWRVKRMEKLEILREWRELGVLKNGDLKI